MSAQDRQRIDDLFANVCRVWPDAPLEKAFQAVQEGMALLYGTRVSYDDVARALRTEAGLEEGGA